MFGIFDIDTYNIGTSQGLRCSGHLRCSNFARKSNFAKLAMFDFKRTIAKKAELRKIPCPSRSCNLRKGVLCAFRPAKASPFVQPLRHRLRDATSPCRGGFGIAENFSSSPEAPLQGELSAKQTERLYEDGPALCSKARSFAPCRAFSVQ